MGVIPHINGSICCWFRPSKYYWAWRDRNDSACWVSAIYSTESVKCNRLEWTISESKVRYHTVYDIISCIRSILCHNNVMTLMLTSLCVCVCYNYKFSITVYITTKKYFETIFHTFFHLFTCILLYIISVMVNLNLCRKYAIFYFL